MPRFDDLHELELELTALRHRLLPVLRAAEKTSKALYFRSGRAARDHPSGNQAKRFRFLAAYAAEHAFALSTARRALAESETLSNLPDNLAAEPFESDVWLLELLLLSEPESEA